ncbi:hypothetical protein SCACP_38550 [Sporomusa carbonis]|uniref:restriction endonuclease subunit S n=1 Tax=Sporomusa carbonis TaxID=3076075 RepID=UPI003A60CDD5
MIDYRKAGISPSCQWPIRKAKFIFANYIKRGTDGAEVLSVSQVKGVYPQNKLIEETGSRVVLALGGTYNFKQVNKGDFVISLRSFQGGIEYSKFNGVVSPAYTVLHPTIKIIDDFYRFLFKSEHFISRINAATVGIRDGKTIKYEEFAELEIPAPPLAEQIAISSFLDRETARIDTLIEKKEAQIRLLEEKRQALISHAVTKG